MLKKNIMIVLGFAGLVASAGASAELYVGATAGVTTWRADCSLYGTCPHVKRHSTAFKTFFGYQSSNIWGIETSYYNTGRVTYPIGGVDNYRSSGVDAAGVMRVKFGASDWSGFAKFGVAFDHGETTVNAYDRSGNQVRYYKIQSSHNSTQPMFGVGVTYQFNKTLEGRIDIDSRHSKAANYDGINSAYATSLNIGLAARF